MSDASSTTRRELSRQFGFWTGLWVVVASMVGSGILIFSGEIIRQTGSLPALLTVWAVGGVLSLTGSLTLAEMAVAMPHAGGEYVYVREAFGSPTAFVYGWATCILSFAAPTAAVAQVAIGYMFEPLKGTSAEWLTQPMDIKIIASVLIVRFTWSHCLGHHESAWVQGATTFFKVATLVGLALVGLFWGKGDWSHFSIGQSLSDQKPGTLAVALVSVMYAYTGWNGAVYLAGEIRDPPRLLPRCLVVGCLAVTGLYLLMNVMYGYALDPNKVVQMKPEEVEKVAALSATQLFGSQVSGFLSVIIGLGALASVSAWVLTGPRVAYAMALDNLMPEFAGRLHAATNTPVLATVAQGVATVLLVWSGPVLDLLDYVGLGLFVLAALMVGAIFPLRRRPNYLSEFRVPFYPLPPLLFLIVSAWVVVNSFMEKPVPMLYSAVTILAGYPLYYLFAQRRMGTSTMVENQPKGPTGLD